MSGHPTRAGWFSGGQIPCDPVPPRREHAFRLVLLGPPGVGKGTQALLLCDTLRACHLSTGDLFRAAKCDGAASPAMRAALEAMQRGELVSDDIVIEMVRERYRVPALPRWLPAGRVPAHAAAGRGLGRTAERTAD